MTIDEPANPGEVREDIPLRPSDSSGRKFGGLQMITASFVILSIAVTVALIIQIYKGDYEIVPHGSVATDSQDCSSIGTNILKLGGNAVDAAIAASFCLAVVNPHSTGLDATGAIMMYDYRQSKAVGFVPSFPIVVDFSTYEPSDVPQLVRGLAFLHNRFGSLDWSELIEPAIDLARNGFSVPTTLIQAAHTVGNLDLFKNVLPGQNITLPILADYLTDIANKNSSSFVPLTTSEIFTSESTFYEFEEFTIYMPSLPQTSNFITFLNTTFPNNKIRSNLKNAEILYRIAHKLNSTMETTLGAASTVSVIDTNELYVSLITGLHSLLGSQTFSANGYLLNKPLDVENSKSIKYMPLIITENYTCGLRVVLSCGEMAGAAQVIFSLLQEKNSSNRLATAIESPRFRKINSQNIAYESNHSPLFTEATLRTLDGLLSLSTSPEPYPNCNAVQQFADSLSSHADSRGGGLSSRF